LLESALSLLLDGLSLGCIYALIALGYTMVYGVIKLINFAHGEFYMMGAYAGVGAALLAVGARLGLPEPWSTVVTFTVAMAAGAVAAGIIAVAVEKVAYKPLRRSSRIAALLTALGVSMLLQNVALKAFSPDTRPFPVSARLAERRYPRIAIPADAIAPGGAFKREVCWTGPDGSERYLGGAYAPIDQAEYAAAAAAGGRLYYYPGVTAQRKQIVIWATVLVLTFALHALVKYSRTGKAMRAVSYDFEAAELMGINVDRVISFTFFIGALLAGAGGVLVASYYGQVKPGMGVMYGLKAFIAAVLGGIGSIGGGVLGGLVLGVAESMVQLSARTAPFRDALAFGLLVAILVFLPRGFFGRQEREKV
jgi:branched-chain amino acid transport system permease protein